MLVKKQKLNSLISDSDSNFFREMIIYSNRMMDA